MILSEILNYLYEMTTLNLCHPNMIYADAEDYFPLSTYLKFTSTDTRACAVIDIIDDVYIEQEAESFFVTLNGTENLPEKVKILQRSAEIIIYNDDGKFNCC